LRKAPDRQRVADFRPSIYGHLHQDALQQLEHANAASARLILSILFERYRPRSIVDVGCGIGTWLAVAAELGVKDTLGLEGDWLDPALARVAPERIRATDLEQPFELGKRFDLAICLEVAEHLSPQAAAGFVESLTRHADVILFSAAIPLQGGDHHVNEQFPDYWEALFATLNYVAVDLVRPQIWYSTDVLVWLRQNTIVFAAEALAADGGPLGGLGSAGPLSLVHPEVFASLAARTEEALAEHRRMLALLSSGKTLSAVKNEDGTLSISVGSDPTPG
jgi:SAM-dependent methyltransferase